MYSVLVRSPISVYFSVLQCELLFVFTIIFLVLQYVISLLLVSSEDFGN